MGTAINQLLKDPLDFQDCQSQGRLLSDDSSNIAVISSLDKDAARNQANFLRNTLSSRASILLNEL
jgi:hypothetical protein